MDRQISSLVDRWEDPAVWSTERVAPNKQFDCWRDFVIDAHLHWSIRPIHCERFPAFIRQGRFDGFRVTHLTSAQGGIVGTRGAREMAQDSEALYNLIYIAEGSICLAIDGEDLMLNPGSFALWDSARPMTFITGAGLRQITLAVPQRELQLALPRADDFVGRRIEATSGLSRLFVDHLISLDARFGELPRGNAGHVLHASVELLASTLSAQAEPCTGRSGKIVLQGVMAYIDRHLDDPELDTRRVASDCGITERHLHRLFERADTTAAAWIRRQRLDRCRQDLRAAETAHLSITQIAYRWGFGDSSSFSKIFKREFACSPKDYRAAGGFSSQARRASSGWAT